MSFKIVKLTLRLITPLVMAGADTGSVEFRIPEIKGLLRYWYRLRYVDMWDGRGKLHELGSEEARLFGSTSGASKIWLWGDVDGEKVGWRDAWGGASVPPPISYWRGMRVRDNGELKELEIYPIGTHIHLNIGMKGLSDDEEFEFWKTVWALVYLGGIGRRWRRGLGSVEIVPDESDIPDEIRGYFEVEEDVGRVYCRGMRWVGLDGVFDVSLYSYREGDWPWEIFRRLDSLSEVCVRGISKGRERKGRKVSVKWIKTFSLPSEKVFVLVNARDLYCRFSGDVEFVNCHSRHGRAGSRGRRGRQDRRRRRRA